MKRKKGQNDEVPTTSKQSTALFSDSSDNEGDSDSDSDALEDMIQSVVEEAENPRNEPPADQNQAVDAQDEPMLYCYPELPPLMWKLDKVFHSREEKDMYLKKEDCWSYRTKYTTKSGVTTVYRCNKVPFVGEQCTAEVRVECEIDIVSSGNESNEEPDLQQPEPNQEQQAALPVAEQNLPIQQPEPNQEHQAEMPVGEQNVEQAQANAPEIEKEVYKVFRINREHNHEELKMTKKKIKPEIEKIILDLHKVYKPQSILFELRDREDIEKDDIPSLRQVRNVIEKFKQKEYGKKPITMRQLSTFVEQNMAVPENEDKAFILSFERSPSNEAKQYFRYFVTTKRLLRNAEKATNIHADGTYKVSQEKLPLIVVGSTDMTRRFHLIGLTITSNETALDYEFTFKSVQIGIQKITKTAIMPAALICDADSAIHKGFRDTFNDDSIKIIMCYAHVMDNVQGRYKYNEQENKQGIMQDIRNLHLAPNEHAFKMGYSLFIEKWGAVEDEAVKKLKKSFFRKNSKWYIGAGYRIPKTNNALERFNGCMKIFQTQYAKKPLKQFMKAAMKIVEQRSKQYIADKEPFQSELIVSAKQMQDGIAYSHSNFIDGPEKENGEVDFFLFRSGIDKEISIEDVNEFQAAEYETFDDFAKKAFDIWKVTFPADPKQWKMSTCSCPAFDANYICKHIIGNALQFGLFNEEEHQQEENYDDVPLFTVKRGRPKRASSARNKD